MVEIKQLLKILLRLFWMIPLTIVIQMIVGVLELSMRAYNLITRKAKPCRRI